VVVVAVVMEGGAVQTTVWLIICRDKRGSGDDDSRDSTIRENTILLSCREEIKI